MTDDGTTPDRRSDLVANDGDGLPTARETWERLPPDPDAETHLGYELSEWERIETTDGTDTRIFLPADAAEVHDDSFIVVDDAAIVDLPARR